MVALDVYLLHVYLWMFVWKSNLWNGTSKRDWCVNSISSPSLHSKGCPMPPPLHEMWPWTFHFLNFPALCFFIRLCAWALALKPQHCLAWLENTDSALMCCLQLVQEVRVLEPASQSVNQCGLWCCCLWDLVGVGSVAESDGLLWHCSSFPTNRHCPYFHSLGSLVVIPQN